MKFLSGAFLWHLLWILPMIALLAWTSWRRREKLLGLLFGSKAGQSGYVSLSKPMRLLRIALFAGICAMLAIAAARPSWGQQILPMSSSGRDILVLFDTSKSMLCKDVQPSRLEHGKWLVREIVKRNPGDRFGLVAFSGKAFLECPITSDATSFLLTLNELDTETIPVGGTNLQDALETALRAFNAAESGHRAILLVSDGDDLTGDASKPLEQLVNDKIPVFVAGVGDPSQPPIIQLRDENGSLKTLKDSKGDIVKSPVNEAMLGKFAVKTSGIYVRSTASATGLDELQSRIRGLVPKEFDSAMRSKPIERFAIPAAAALPLLLLWLVLSEAPARVTAALALILFVAMPGQAQESTDAPPPPSEKKTDETPVELYNSALEIQKAGKDEKEASKLYSRSIATASKDMEIHSKATQNLGVISHGEARKELQDAQQQVKGQNLDEAVKKVDTSLKVLDSAEEIYRDALRHPDRSSSLSGNQQILINDRAKAETLKKKIEELKKKQQEAIDKAQQAQQQNQQQDKSQNEAGEKQEKSQKPENMTEQARQAAKEFEKAAQDLQQKNMEESAKHASDELEKAADAQKRNDAKQAKEHIKKALEHLGQKDSDSKDNGDNNKGKSKEESKDKKQEDKGNQKDSKDDGSGKKDKALPDIPKQQSKPKEANPDKDQKDIDPDQAESILEMMAADEKSLRDELKERRKEAYGIKEVEKDW